MEMIVGGAFQGKKVPMQENVILGFAGRMGLILEKKSS